jgi:hypothetical protein
MKISDILVENFDLFELKMAPGSLRQAAAGINAVAGMEFEIAFPDLNLDLGDGESEPDYDQDAYANSISDIIEFFDNPEYNSRRDLNRLEQEMIEEFNEWASEQADKAFNDDVEDVVWDYIKDNYKEGEDDISLEDRLKDALENQNRDFDDARDEYTSNYMNYDVSEVDWLRDRRIRSFSDVNSFFDITWPYYTQSGGGSVDAEEFASSFGSALNTEYDLSTQYHGVERKPTTYAIEPDSSIDPDGLEFVSPPKPLVDMLDDLKKVQAWAIRQGGETNKSTGLHMNVSIADKDFSNLDYVKLAILLGDEYVLNQFGRLSNTYTPSALKNIRRSIELRPEEVPGIMQKLKQGLAQEVSKLIETGISNKYVSIGLRSGYIEFRSPGGDWLNQDIEKLENTLLRFVVALDAALDPEKYRREYMVKLYKLLTPEQYSVQDQDVIKLFARTAVGDLSKSALLRYLQQRALSRAQKKPPVSGQKYVWKVYVGAGGTVLSLLAKSETEAKQLAQMMNPAWEKISPGMLVAEPVKIYHPGPLTWYRLTNDRGQSHSFQATSEIEALQKMSLSIPEYFAPPRQVDIQVMRTT